MPRPDHILSLAAVGAAMLACLLACFAIVYPAVIRSDVASSLIPGNFRSSSASWLWSSGMELPRCTGPLQLYAASDLECLVELGDIDFALHVRGPGAKEGYDNVPDPKTRVYREPIVLPSPGWGIECDLKLNGLEAFFASRTFICMVTRGTYPSGSPANDSDMTSTAMAHDLELLRQWLGLEQLSLYAHSIGGTIALGYAELYPLRASSLVLVEGKMLDYDDTPTLMRFVETRYTDPRYSAAIEALMIAANFSDPRYPKDDSEYRDLFLRLLPWYFADPDAFAPRFEQDLKRVTLPQNRVTIVHDQQNKLNPAPNQALLGQVKAPTLIIAGDQDAFCTANVAAIMHQGIKGSELVVFEACGHLPWIERRREFEETLENWWLRY